MPMIGGVLKTSRDGHIIVRRHPDPSPDFSHDGKTVNELSTTIPGSEFLHGFYPNENGSQLAVFGRCAAVDTSASGKSLPR